ncbi:MAG: copper-binding protein [Planctomycetota bacterium]
MSRSRSSIAGAATISLLAGLGGCAEDASEPDPMVTVSYNTSGVVAQLPTSSGDLQVRHELIPDFRETLNQDPPGGMPAMTMPFPLGEGVSLDGLQPGDHVELTFDVDYRSEDGAIAGYRLSEIREVSAPQAEPIAELPAVVEIPELTMEEQTALDADLDVLTREVEAFVQHTQSASEPLGAIGEGAAVDPWGQPYRVTVIDEESVIVVSAGPDRTFDTADDIAELIQVDHDQDGRD